MKPQFFKSVNCIPGEDQPEYAGLPVEFFVVDGVPMMQTLWKPSPEELRLLNEGGLVCLTIQGRRHPPVLLYAQSFDGREAPEDIGAE
jgi:hypothetical protein